MEFEVEPEKVEITSKKPRKLSDHVINNFSKLSSKNANERIKSSIQILKHIIENKNVENDSEEKYSLARLIRGLGSSKTHVRASYYTVLVGYLHAKSSANVEDIIKHISEQLHTSGSYTKAENADICTGQILACGAIIRSHLWKAAQLPIQLQILEMMFKASKERSYLPQLAYTFTLAALQTMTVKKAKVLAEIIIKEVPETKAEISLDSLYLLYILSQTPGVRKDIVKEKLGTKDIFCTENMEYLSSVLLNIPKLAESNHPFYDIASTNLTKPEMWSNFDQCLSSPNRNKHLIIIMLYTNIIKKMEDPADVLDMLTENLIQLLIDKNTRNYKGQNNDKESQDQINKFSNALEELLKKECCKWETKVSVLKKLLFHRNTFVYDKINGNRIIQRLLVLLPIEAIKKLSKSIRNIIKESGKKYHNMEKLAASHLLIKLMNSKAVKEEIEWKTEQLQLLMELALFKGNNDDDIGIELAESLKKSFFGALDLKLTKIEHLHTIIMSLVRQIDSKISSENLDTVLRDPITPEQYEIWQKTINKVSKIEPKLKKKSSVKMVFLTLFLHMGIQLFNEPKLATDSLNELFECYDKSKQDKKSTHENPAEEDTHSDPQWIDVIIELFLSWLSRSSHLLRNIVNIVFPYITNFISVSTIHQILSVLDPNNKDLMLSKSSESGDEDDSESEDKENNVEENVDENKEDSDDEDEESDSGVDEDDEDMEKETNHDKLRMALHQVLNDKAGSDAESVDLDDMSDTEAEKLDQALTDVFRQFKPNTGNRKKQSKDDETLMHFRIRALDLIELYLDSTTSLDVTLEIIVPLLQAVEYCIKERHQKPLLDRLERCLKKLPKLKGFTDTNDVDSELFAKLLEKLLEDESKTNTMKSYMSKHICDCVLFLLKQTESMTDLPDSITATLVKGIKKCLYSRDNAPMLLFKNVLQRNWRGIKDLVPHILKAVCDKELKIFKRNQAVELAKLFYNNKRYLKDGLEEKRQHLAKPHRKFSVGVITGMNEADEKYLAGKFMVNLLSLLSDMKKSPLNIDVVDFEAIAESVKEFQGRANFNALLTQMVKNYCRTVNHNDVVELSKNDHKKSKNDATVSKQMKRKSSDIIQSAVVSEKKKRKKKVALYKD